MRKTIAVLSGLILALAFVAPVAGQNAKYYGTSQATIFVSYDTISDSIRQADYIDSTQVIAGGFAGSDLVSPLRIPTHDIYVKNVIAGDSLKAKSLALTSYLIANGATILRGTATVAGLLTPQALSNPVQLILADSTLTAARSGYTYIARPVAAKTTGTLPSNPAVGTNFIFGVADADSLRITCAGSDSLIDGTGAAWKTTTSVAGWIKVIMVAANKWFFIQYNGTWTSY